MSCGPTGTGDYLSKPLNLSDVPNKAEARDNLLLLSDPDYLESLWRLMMMREYQTGSLWVTTDIRNPAVFFGFGSWERYASGKVLVGINQNDTSFASVGQTGGEKDHTLTIEEMPSHNHGIALGAGRVSAAIYNGSNGDIRQTDSTSIQMAGGNYPHNNLQPYVVVNIWRRVA